MPRLSQVRFVSIGHPQARFDDVTIDLRGPNGRATDTTLWLRNGGGKSSLLNLFFVLVRPNLRDFLGAKANEGERKLLDYVTRGDHAVVVAEWELDARGGLGAATDEPERFLTGVFMERSRSDTAVDRHFFAARVNPRVAGLRIEDLPLTYESESGRVVRRSLASFRSAWRDLDRKHPGWGVEETDSQDGWGRILDAAGIDPALYGYQLRMNHREGGADDLFKFRDTDSFVDFFLELVLDPTDGERIAQNINNFRERLRELNLRLIPEQEFTTGLRDRLTPLLSIAASRAQIAARTGVVAAMMHRLKGFLKHHLVALENNIADYRARAEAAVQAEQQMRNDSLLWKRRAATLRLHGAEQRMVELQREIHEIEERISNAEYDWRLWDAVVPLRDQIRAEAEAARIMAALSAGRREHAPLLKDLESAAVRLHARLRGRAGRLRGEEAQHRADATAARTAARDARDEAAGRSQEAAGRRTEASHIARRIEAESRARADLLRQGALREEGEPPGGAAERLHSAIGDAENFIAATQALVRRLVAEDKQVQEDQQKGAVDLATARSDLDQRRRRLDSVQRQREEIEQDPILLRHIGAETADLDRLDVPSAEQILRRAASSADDHVVDLKVALAEGERALRALEATHLLPPSRDVERLVVRLREERINASSGWEFIAETMNAERALAFVRSHPALATGVLIRDQDYERAITVLQARKLSFDGAVLVAPQSATVGEGTLAGTVFGPTSTALYSKESGLQERVERERQQERNEHAMEAARGFAVAIRSLADRLHAFRLEHPAGWFAAQEEALASGQEAVDALRSHLTHLGDIRRGIADQMQDAEHRIAERQRALTTDQKHLSLVEAHLKHYDFNPAAERLERDRLVEAAEAAEEEAVLLRSRALALDGEAAEADARSRASGEDARLAEQEVDSVDFLPESGLPAPEAGDVEAARAEFQRLRARFNDEAGEPKLRTELEAAQSTAAAARETYRKRLNAVTFLPEHDVRLALAELEDPAQADLKRDEARDLYNRLTGSAGTPRAKEEALNKEIGRLKAAAKELQPIPPVTEVLSPEEAEAAAEEADRLAQEATRCAVIQAEEALALRARVSEHTLTHTQIQAHTRRLGDLADTNASLLATAVQGEDPSWVEPCYADVEERIDALSTELQMIVSENSQLDAMRSRYCSAIRGWMGDSRFGELKSSLRARLQSYADDVFEHTAAELQAEIQQRLVMVNDEIEEKAQHKRGIVSATLSAAEEGIRALESAARRSRIPEHLPGLGSHDFLQITVSAPADAAEREARVVSLIDRIISEGTSPDGLKLIQQAVRRLGRPITVRVLFPDPDARPRWVSIVEMAKQSGGERLTSAVLLFCTLARMRAARRGQRLNLSGTLLLDNPIGTASRTKLIELQRDVARAMGIQLFYTTGVDDLNAVGMLDKVVRLKNERRDRWSGECLVEPDEEVHHLEVASLHLGDRNPVVVSGEPPEVSLQA